MTTVAEALSIALGHHRAGKLETAAEICRRILEAAPDHVDSLHLLGVIAYQAGRPQMATTLIGRAVALRPDFAEALSNLGNAWQVLGQPEAAAQCYERALACKPDFAEVHNNLGNLLQSQGCLAEAVACYQRATTLKPGYAEAYYNLGNALNQMKHPAEAMARFRHAIALKPDYAEAHNNLGNSLYTQGRLTEAAACFGSALAAKPGFAEALSNLGNALRMLGRPEEAKARFAEALAGKPDYPEAHNNLGLVYQEEGRTALAMACFDQALALKPDYANALINRGNVFQEAGRLVDAIGCFSQALAVAPEHPGAYNNRAMALLAAGRYAEGWRDYEWRWGTPQLEAAKRDFDRPQWRGEAAGGRILLVHAEQGFGDTLQFCRYLPLLAERGFRVVIEAPAPLLRLLARLPGVEQVVAHGAALPAFDLHCPMLSLPGAFGTTLDTVPARDGYLSADPAAVAAWRERLDQVPGLKVGLVWAGNPRSHSPDLAAVDRRRSMTPETLAPLFEIPGIRFVSLQKDGAKAEFDLLDFMDEVKDFADTAALLVNLDLVICVDTAVAHLAGGFGTPVWLMNRFDSCWRWLRDRDDSPWYSSLRLFRQTAPGDWAGVVARIGDALRRYAPEEAP